MIRLDSLFVNGYPRNSSGQQEVYKCSQVFLALECLGCLECLLCNRGSDGIGAYRNVIEACRECLVEGLKERLDVNRYCQ